LNDDGDLMMAGNPFVGLLNGHIRVVMAQSHFLVIRSFFVDTDVQRGVRRLALSGKMRQAGVTKSAGLRLYTTLKNATNQSALCFPMFTDAVEEILFEAVDRKLAVTDDVFQGVFERLTSHFVELVVVLKHLQFGIKYFHVDQNEAAAALSLEYVLSALRGLSSICVPWLSSIAVLFVVRHGTHRRRGACVACSGLVLPCLLELGHRLGAIPRAELRVGSSPTGYSELGRIAQIGDELGRRGLECDCGTVRRPWIV
jgi:hypothetical protein